MNVPHGNFVLLVDDDLDDIDLTERSLKRQGFTVVSYSDVSSALRFLKNSEEKPFAILTDLSMPKQDGWDFCRALEQLPDVRDIPVIVMTGLHDARAPTHALALLNKPFSEENILNLLKHYKKDASEPDGDG